MLAVSLCMQDTLQSVATDRDVIMQIVFAVLGCWGVGIYSAMKIFGGGKKESTPSAAPEQLEKH